MTEIYAVIIHLLRYIDSFVLSTASEQQTSREPLRKWKYLLDNFSIKKNY